MRRIGAWLIVMTLAALGSGGAAAEGRSTVHVRGSNSLLPVAQKVAEAYMAAHPETAVVLSGGDTGPGLKALLDGTSDIAMISAVVPDDVRKRASSLQVTLVTEPVAVDGIVPVVHPDNPATSLSRQQLGAIYAGRITNWKTVGGPDAPIAALSLPVTSGTADAWRYSVLGELVQTPKVRSLSAGELKAAVAGDPLAIGFLGLGASGGTLKILAVDGVAPSHETVRQGRFPIRRELALVTTQASGEAAKRFVAFFLTPEAQALVEAAGLQAIKPGAHP